MKLSTFTGIVCATALSFATTACLSMRSPSGFLPNFSQLHIAKDASNSVLVYRAPGLDLSNYDGVYIEPPITIIDADQHDPKIAEQLAAYMIEALRSELGERLPIVGNPGVRTVRVRAALTDIVKGARPTSPVTTIHHQPKAPSRGAVGAAAPFLASISLDGEALDGETGIRLAASSGQRAATGSKKINPLTDWVVIKMAIDEWAAQMAALLIASQAP